MIKVALQADIDRFVEDGSLDDNIESFLSHDDTDARDTVGRGMDVSKGVFICYSVMPKKVPFC